MNARNYQDLEYFTEVKVNFIDVIGHWGEATLCKEIEILYKPPEKGYEDFEVTLRYTPEGKTSVTAVPSGEHITGLKSGCKAIWLMPTYFYSVAPGQKFSLRLQAYDPKTYKHYYYDLEEVFCRPKANDETTVKKTNFQFNFKEYSGGDNNNFYGPKPGIIVNKWPDLTIDGPYPDFQSIKIQLKDSNNTIYFTGTRTYTEQNGEINWKEQEISKDVPSKYSSAATLSVYLIDKVGTSVLVGSKYYESGRSSISFLPGNITFNASPYNPYYEKQNLLIIKHPLGSSPASAPQSTIYSYSLESRTIAPNETKEFGNMCETTYNRDSLLSIFPKDRKNGAGRISIKITAQNVFGDTASISTTLPYDYYLMAEWEVGSKVGVKHDFGGGEAEQIPNFSLEEYSSANKESYQLNLRCFCSGESAVLQLPKAIDPNSGEGIYYRVQRAVAVYSNGIPLKEELNYEDLAIFHRGDEYKYQIPPSDGKDYCCYFRVCATNRTSNAEYTTYKYSPLIFLCRTLNPSFNVNSVELTPQNDGLGIVFTKKELDFGQSNVFKNYKRDLASLGIKDLPVAKLKLKINNSPNFDFIDASGTLSSFDNINSSEWVFNVSVPTWENWKNQKIYLELKLEVDYGPNSKVESQPYTYFTIISGVPTVAHRKNHVGINTAQFNDDEVLVIENFNTRKKIVLKSSDGSRSVTIDLSSATISGATISGGTWD